MPKPITALLIGVALSAGCTINVGSQIDELAKLRQQAKFQPTACYNGVDVPEDLAPLTSAVNSAIADIANQPQPRDPFHVKRRLEQLMQEVDLFATEDREEAYRYVIRIWRAAGMKSESGLFPRSDADRLRQMPGCKA